MTNLTKGLRFASLIRVSTEKQEKEGESLSTQRKQNELDVERLGGSTVARYGGQEHGTPGWEKQEVDRLIADAAKGKFDAVIVAYADRWSRDNAKSKEGLEAFRKHNIRFFVGSMEMDLFDPQYRFILGMSAEVGEFIARQGAKKSVENRIERAKKGMPACGRLPFGRTFDKKTGLWGVNSEKKAIVENAAKRYLAGESMEKLATEYGFTRAYLYKVLVSRCGTEWLQEFRSDTLRINEQVITKVPALLPEKTIKAVQARAAANRSYHHVLGQHRHTRHPYLLGGALFCGHCGLMLTGQVVRHCGRRYYRHSRNEAKCVHPVGWVSADEIENAVMRDLFDCFGNPVAVQKAVEAATPNADKVEEHRKRRDRLTSELEKVAAAKQRILRQIEKGSISEAETDKILGELKQKQKGIEDERRIVLEGLESVSTPEEIREAGVWFASQFYRYTNAKLIATVEDVNGDFDGMDWEERRALVEKVFSGKSTDGKRMGVYVEWLAGQEEKHKQKAWRFRITGKLIDCWGTSPHSPFTPSGPEDSEFSGGPYQKELLEENDAVTPATLSRQRIRSNCLPFMLTGIAGNPDDLPQGGRIPDELQAIYSDVYTKAVELREKGLSNAAIRDELNMLGFRTRTGKFWRHPQQICKLLKSFASTAKSDSKRT